MCMALRDLMRDEIQEELSSQYSAAQEEFARRMLRGSVPIGMILEFTDVTEERVEELAEELRVGIVRE